MATCLLSVMNTGTTEDRRDSNTSREDPLHVAVTFAALVALLGIVESERGATVDVDTETGPFGSARTTSR